MSHIGGMITGNVGITDIQAVLGTSENRLKYLCKHSAIIKWAMYKPVKSTLRNTDEQIDKTTMSWKPTADWWLGNFSGERWGMKFNIADSIGAISTRTSEGKTYREPTSGFFYQLMRDNLRWTYQPPQGSGTTPASIPRQIDFAGYNHDVPCPLPFTYTRTLYVSGASSTMATFTLDCGIRNPSEEVAGGLTLINMMLPYPYSQMIATLGRCYVGVLFYNTTLQDCFWQCSDTRLEALYGLDATARAKALHVSLTNADFTNQYAKNHKDWKTRAFLCSKALGYCETLLAGQGHYLLPCDEAAATCTFAIAGSLVISDFTASKVGTNVNITVQLTNNTGYQQTVSSPKIELVTVGTSLVQASYTWGNTTINNGDTAVLNHTFTGMLDTYLDAVFTATYSGGTLSQTVRVVNK